jgi:FixJ family two-component response regulator
MIVGIRESDTATGQSPGEKALYDKKSKHSYFSSEEKDLPGIVHVVDDDASYRTAVQRLLSAAGYRVLTYSSGQQFLDQRPDGNAKGCILLDVLMPGVSGPELQNRLIDLGWTLPIVFLSGQPDISVAVRTIKAGAENFLVKPVSSNELLQAIERAITRREKERTLEAGLETLRSLVSTLTPRQFQVFELMVQGKTNKQAAHELGGSARTIKAHRQAIMEKMKVQSIAQLAVIAERLGLFRPDNGK